MPPKSKPKLTEGPVGALLIRLTIPMIWGLFSIFTFNLVDTIFVARLGTTHLAAISFTFPVVMVATNLAIGLGIGTSSVVARAIGENDHKKIQNLATSSLVLSLSVVFIFMTIGFLTMDPLFKFIGANEETLVLIKDYMNIWYVGLVFLFVPLVGNYIIRATGDMFWPGIIMVISSVVNLILDPIFIFGLFGFPRLEMKGAALATLVAWVMTFCASSAILFFREKFISLRCPSWSVIVKSWKSIMHVALPAAGTHMIVPVGVGIVMSMVAVYGKEAVAAFGAASRIEMFAFIIVLALSAVIGPFVGQNVGAKRCDRINEALKKCYRFCIYFGLLEAIVLAYFSKEVMMLFDSDPLVIYYGRMFLLIMPLAYCAHGIIFIASGVFNGSGHPLPAVVVSVCRMFVLYIPLAFCFKGMFGVLGIYSAYTIATLIMGVVAVKWSFKYIRSFESNNVVPAKTGTSESL